MRKSTRWRVLFFVILLAASSLDAQNWQAVIEIGSTNTPFPFCNAIQNGIAQVPPSAVTNGDYRTRFLLNDTIYVGNSFSLEARVQNSEANGGINAFDPGIYLDGCSIDVGATLMGDNRAVDFTSIYAGTSARMNVPNLVQDFSSWRVIRYDVRNNIFRVYIDNQLLFTLPYSGSIDFIQQIMVRFKGSGLLDWLKLYDRNNQLIWTEDFLDCNNLTPPPTWSASLNFQTNKDTTVCKGESLSFTAQAIPGSTYRWRGPNGFSSTQSNVILNNINPSDTGFYYIEVDYKNCVTLIDSIKVKLNTLQTPPLNFLGKDTTLCLGDSILLGQQYPCASYRWQNGARDSVFIVNKAGTYTVEINIDNQIFKDTIQIQYYTLPKIYLGNDTTLCPGESILLNASLPISATYRWQDGSTNPTFLVQNPGLYLASVTDLCGNSTTDSIEIAYFNTLTILNLGRDTTLCPGESLVLDAFDPAAIDYRWQDGSTNPTFTASLAGIYIVTTKDECNNIEVDSIQVRYFELVKPVNLGKDTTLCPGERITLRATDRAAVRYQWKNGATDSILIVQNAGNYAVTITDACGKQFSDSIQVDYYKVLKPLNLGRDTMLCPGQTLLLNAFDSAAVIYRWQDSSRNATYLVNRPGSYLVYIADNCGNIATDIIRVGYFEVLQSIDIGRDTTLCPGETITLDATNKAARFYRWQNGSTDSTFKVTQPGIYTVQVTDNCGNTLTDNIKVEYYNVLKSLDLGKDTLLCPGSSIILDASDAAAISYRWQDGSSEPTLKVGLSGIYIVELTDNCNNIEIDSITIEYYKLITTIDIGPRDTLLCVGDIMILDASSEAQGKYLWQDGITTPTYTVTNPGIYQVQVNDFCGNSAADEIRIRYTDVPKPDFLGGDTIVCEGSAFRLNATAPDATFYRWQDGLLQPIYPVTKPGFYSVTVGNACGNVIYSLTVGMEYCGPCRTFVPTAFSPNGDGNNDQFQIGTECIFTHYELRVFNRWGLQVFASTAPWTLWDGTQLGKELPPGVYVWQLRYKAEDGSAQTLSGDVLLMR